MNRFVSMREEINLSGPEERLNFELECIDRHNLLRRYHQADPLKRNPELTRKAQKHAEKLLRKCSSTHNEDGFTVCHIINRSVSASEITDMWYSEISRVNFSNLTLDDVTERFTQLVWKDTQEIGVGLARDGNDHVYVVAAYSPPGNIPHLVKYNLCPPS
uniref:Golgi-associated plant pathogenesis-related protein 1-like n=1 Tax=Phallusia mammillata TaxID=59560 RepID=A0A6F9DD06_9ASCI|nr:golgi-associated plant pathogenesis-related protein 1-like [Phallusia mammillata]